MAELSKYLKDLESAVGRIGHTSGSALPAVLELCREWDSDSEFVAQLRGHISENASIPVLKILQLKKAACNLVHFFKSTTVMEELPNTLKPLMEVRWSSCYRMLESIRKCYAEVSVALAL